MVFPVLWLWYFNILIRSTKFFANFLLRRSSPIWFYTDDGLSPSVAPSIHSIWLFLFFSLLFPHSKISFNLWVRYSNWWSRTHRWLSIRKYPLICEYAIPTSGPEPIADYPAPGPITTQLFGFLQGCSLCDSIQGLTHTLMRCYNSFWAILTCRLSNHDQQEYYG